MKKLIAILFVLVLTIPFHINAFSPPPVYPPADSGNGGGASGASLRHVSADAHIRIALLRRQRVVA